MRNLAWDEASKKKAFMLKPDVVGIKNGQAAWIIDTKWKRLTLEKSKDGVVPADVYQMYAYANSYACPDVVLLYPHHPGLDGTTGVRASYALTPPLADAGAGIKRIRIATIDLSELKTVASQLRSTMFGLDAVVAAT